MGYEAEKKKIEKRVGILNIVALLFVVVVVGTLCLIATWVPVETWKYYFALPKTGTRRAGEMRVHFLDVGQGDCQLVELPDGKILLIDGGADDESATRIMRYLNALKIETIDYLLITHADSDHCGGLEKIVRYKEIKRAFLPLADATENEAYATVYAELLEKDCAWEYSKRSINLSADGEFAYTLRFLYPYTYTTENPSTGKGADDNESSAVVWLDYQGASVLFTGDAPMETEEKLMRDHRLDLLDESIKLTETELLKVAHHGSADATSLSFLQYLNVKQAVISCGKNNAYGHPTTEVLSALSMQGVGIYRTDERGNLVWTVSQTGDYALRALQ